MVYTKVENEIFEKNRKKIIYFLAEQNICDLM